MAFHGKHLLKNGTVRVSKTRKPVAPSGRPTGSNRLTSLEQEIYDLVLTAFDRVPERAYETMLDDKTGWQYEAIFVGALMSVQADIADVLHRQLVTAGQTEAIDLGKQLASEFRALEKATTPTPSQLALGFRFDVNSKQALDWANREAGQLITNMGTEQRKVIGQLVGQSMTQGLTAQQTGTAIHRLLNDVIPGTEYGKVTARTIGANMNGLTARSEQAVWNRAQKTAQDLADRGITGTKAVETLKKDTDRYAEKLRKSRARTIARTEIIRAAEEGRQQSWNQAIDKGLINKTTAKKTWRAGPFDVCPICSRLHGTSVPVQGDWGPNLQTPPAHPNCRCSMVLSSGVTEPPRAIGDGSTGNPFKLEFPQPPSPNDFPPLPTGPGPVAPPAPVPQPAPAVPEFQPASRQVLEDMIDRQRTAAITSDALPELEESLVDYVNGSGNYSLTNATLRGEFIFDDLMPKTQKKVIDMTDDLDELIKANVRTEDDLLLFRGVKDAGLDEWEFADVGDIVTEAGFGSTSFDRAIAQRFARKDGIVLEIEAPRGTKGIMPQAFRTGDKDFLLDGKGELEYLLQRNTQFEIVSREGNTIRVRIVGQIDPEPISTVFSPPPPVATPPAPAPVAPTPAPVAPPAPVVPAPTPAPPPPVPSPTVVSGPSVASPVDTNLRSLKEAFDLPTASRGELKTRVDGLNRVLDDLDELVALPVDGVANTTVRLSSAKNQSKGGHFSAGTRGPKPRRGKGESYSSYFDRVREWSKREVKPEILVARRIGKGIGEEMNSFAHELGHRIDRVGNDYFTRRAWTKFKSGETLTENEQAVIDLIEEVKKAETFQRYYARTTQKQYFASPHEIWARSFSQWTANFTKNTQMIDAVDDLATSLGYQFTKEEWDVIGPLVTRVLERRGLMKPARVLTDDIAEIVDELPESFQAISQTLADTAYGRVAINPPSDVVELWAKTVASTEPGDFAYARLRYRNSGEVERWRESVVKTLLEDEDIVLSEAQQIAGTIVANFERASEMAWETSKGDAIDGLVDFYARVWKKQGLTKAQAKQALLKQRDAFVDFAKEAKVSIQISPSNLESVLDDGRFLSQFESGTSGGIKDFYKRKKVEAQSFGLRFDEDVANRPIYGHLELPGRGNTSVDSYGSARVVLKDSVRDRTTYVTEDSLSSGFTPSRLNEPNLGTVQFDSDGFPPSYGRNYTETQVFGGVSVDDIQEVVFDTSARSYKPPSPELIEKLEQRGIPYRFVEHVKDGTSTSRFTWRDIPNPLL